MKKTLLGCILLIASALFPIFVQAQYVLLDADKAFELYNFRKAVELYEQAYKKKPTLKAAERIAECYKNLGNYAETESWFAIAAQMPKSSAENTLNYARALQENSKYTEAKVQYLKYSGLNKEVTAKTQSLWLLSCDSALKWMRNPTDVQIKNEKTLNSAKSDWGATKLGVETIFASDRGVNVGDKTTSSKPFLKFDGAKKPDVNIYGWTGNAYLRLYTINGTDSVKLFPLDAKTGYHVGPASFTHDGKEIYFALTRIPSDLEYTRAGALKGKLATINTEIYYSKKDNADNWSTPVAFSYNNVNLYSNGDPYISNDGQSLYFASSMPGGKGGTDLYVSQKTEAGEWGLPVNLQEINTEGNERSPSFDTENNFFFSSNGLIGMGGLDIYRSKIVGGKITEPVNLGYPTNSPQDDFAYNGYTAETGFLSSNRLGGLGEDDIYSFIIKKSLTFRLEGIAYNKKTGQPLSGAVVRLEQNNGQSLIVETGGDGAFKFKLDKDLSYTIKGDKTGFRGDVGNISTLGLVNSSTLKKDLYLDAIELNKEIRLENIYYDFDKSNIRPDAAVELNKLVKIMQDNPTIWIELGSHTDSRGNDQYNQWLSQSRANSAVQYIIDKGVNKNRITAKGYGETRLLNKCSNGVKCTEEEHQLNRRTEFTIVKF